MLQFLKDKRFDFFRHAIRRNLCLVLGQAEVQDASGEGLKEGDKVNVYVEKDGTMWIRKVSEFNDGRFSPEGFTSHWPVEME